MRAWKRWSIVLLMLLSACTVSAPDPPATTTPSPTVTPPSMPAPALVRPRLPSLTTAPAINLDAPTQARIAQARRVVFVVPFSHWDTDWHDTFTAYAAQADRNILDAIQVAQHDPRFRYTFEQVLFVQHIWNTHPEVRATLRALVRRRQLTFAWGGTTQPETSLAAATVQVRNLQLGQDWIAQTFGAAYVPDTAWQSDAFGNSAALPIFLSQSAIKYLFIGRWQNRCDPVYASCTPLPHLFQWHSPAAPAQHVLVAYQSYSQAYGAIAGATGVLDQIAALRKPIANLAARTSSKYLFLPFGDDFRSPSSSLPTLVDRWNASNHEMLAVIADPETAFGYIATETLPAVTADMNPIWQAFYATRPAAKIADKESEAYLTAADKFGVLLNTMGLATAPSTAWYTATVNAHYDNIGAVSFDRVWEASQRTRFEQAVATAGDDLSRTLARITNQILAPVVVFNPLSWQRSGVVELQGALPDSRALPSPLQRLGPDHVAFWVDNVPPVGYLAPAAVPSRPIEHPVAVTQTGRQVTLSNGLVSLTLDGDHGGALSSLSRAGGPRLLKTFGDDVVYLDDHGDVYGAFFGAERARESLRPSTVTILAGGPLITRVQAVFELGGQPITKTVTLEANSTQIGVVLSIAALPETTAILQVPTTRSTTTRTDDLGFAPLAHTLDDSPIVSGTVTYRREVFYPITAWTDVEAGGAGLALLTHGLQGLGGAQTLNVMLSREVSDRNDEGVTDRAYHTLRYAYVPHAGQAAQAEIWRAAYAYNQPLVAAWRSGEAVRVQLPWRTAEAQRGLPVERGRTAWPRSASLVSASNGIIADLYPRGDHLEAVVLSYEASRPTTITSHAGQEVVSAAALAQITVKLK